MKAPKLWVCPRSFWYLFFATTLAVPLFVAVFVEFFPAVNADPTVVTYTHGVADLDAFFANAPRNWHFARKNNQRD